MEQHSKRSFAGQLASLEREINRHRAEMESIELKTAVQHGNISPWLITSGRTLIAKGDDLLSLLALDPDFDKHCKAYLRELKIFRKFYSRWEDSVGETNLKPIN